MVVSAAVRAPQLHFVTQHLQAHPSRLEAHRVAQQPSVSPGVHLEVVPVAAVLDVPVAEAMVLAGPPLLLHFADPPQLSFQAILEKQDVLVQSSDMALVSVALVALEVSEMR